MYFLVAVLQHYYVDPEAASDIRNIGIYCYRHHPRTSISRQTKVHVLEALFDCCVSLWFRLCFESTCIGSHSNFV